MIHIVQCDDPSLLPFARSRLGVLRGLGLAHISQKYDVGGVTVRVQKSGEHEYVWIEGGGQGGVYLFLKYSRTTADSFSPTYTETTSRSVLIKFAGISTRPGRYKVLNDTSGSTTYTLSDYSYTSLDSDGVVGGIAQSVAVTVTAVNGHRDESFNSENFLEEVRILPKGPWRKFGKSGTAFDHGTWGNDGGWVPNGGGWDVMIPSATISVSDVYTQRVTYAGLVLTEAYSNVLTGSAYSYQNTAPAGTLRAETNRTINSIGFMRFHATTSGEITYTQRTAAYIDTTAYYVGDPADVDITTDTETDQVKESVLTTGAWVTTDYESTDPEFQYGYARVPLPSELPETNAPTGDYFTTIQGCSYLYRDSGWEVGKQLPIYIPIISRNPLLDEESVPYPKYPAYTRNQVRLAGTGYPDRSSRWGHDFYDYIRQGADFIQISETFRSFDGLTFIRFNRLFDRWLTGLPNDGVDRVQMVDGPIIGDYGQVLPTTAIALSSTLSLQFNDPDPDIGISPRYIQLVEYVEGEYVVKQQLDIYDIPAIFNDASITRVIDAYAPTSGDPYGATKDDYKVRAGYVKFSKGADEGATTPDTTILEASILVNEDMLMKPEVVWYTPGKDGVWPPI